MHCKIRESLFKSNWNIAGLFTNDYINLNLYNLCNQYKIKLPIKTVFGGVFSKWHGGRCLRFCKFPNIDQLKKIIDEYNSLNIGVNLTFSNYELSKYDLNDLNGNELLSHCNKNKINGVIVSSDILYDYIKDKYPNLKMVSSLLKVAYETQLGKTDTIEYYNNLINKYDTVVINVSRAFDHSFLKQLSDLSKIEVITNHVCIKNCPMAKSDYHSIIQIDELVRKYGPNLPEQYIEVQSVLNHAKELGLKCAKMHADNPLNSTMLSVSQVEELQKIGISNFKIEGRLEVAGKWIYDLARWFFEMGDDIHKLIQSINYKSMIDGF